MAWIKTLDKYTGVDRIESLVIFNGKLYGAGGITGYLLEWDGASGTWLKVGDIGTTHIYSLIVYNGNLYATSSPGADLYRWDNPGFTLVATDPHGQETIWNMVVFGSNLYGVTGGAGSDGYLYEWDGVSANWTRVANRYSSEYNVYSIAVFNGKIYGGSAANGYLLEWDGISAWTLAAGTYSSETRIRDLIVYNGFLYGFSGPSGHLLRWDGISAWVLAGTAVNLGYGWRSIIFGTKIYFVGSPSSGNPILYSYDGVSITSETVENTGTSSAHSIILFNSTLYVGGVAGVDDSALWEASDILPSAPTHDTFENIGEGQSGGDAYLHLEDNQGNIEITKNDLRRDPTLENAIEISLFTDRRADDIDVLPDTSGDKRGWWGDTLSERPLGSKLWLLRRSKTTSDIPARAEQYVKDALQWMLDDGIVGDFEVSAQKIDIDRLDIKITVTEPKDQTEHIFKYYYNWREQSVSTGRTQNAIY